MRLTRNPGRWVIDAQRSPPGPPPGCPHSPLPPSDVLATNDLGALADLVAASSVTEDAAPTLIAEVLEHLAAESECGARGGFRRPAWCWCLSARGRVAREAGRGLCVPLVARRCCHSAHTYAPARPLAVRSGYISPGVVALDVLATAQVLLSKVWAYV